MGIHDQACDLYLDRQSTFAAREEQLIVLVAGAVEAYSLREFADIGSILGEETNVDARFTTAIARRL